MLYIVKNCVEEDTQIVYNDGAMKLFLYTGGEYGGNEKLKDMLRYFSESNEKNVVDEELSQLHSIVQKVRDNRKVGERYMTLQEYLEYEIKQGVEEGIAEAVDAAVEEAVNAAVDAAVDAAVAMLRELNIPEEQILEQLMQKYALTEEKAKSYLNK